MEKTDAITLLAIDDKPNNLTTLSAVVRDALPQTRVLTATNGPAGIELAAAEDPDVILLDIVMPGMDGFEVCRRLKADDRIKDIPVVFLTALKVDAASRVKALEAGAEGFLAKPLETAELTAQIKAMVKLKAFDVARRSEAARLEALVAARTADLRESEEQLRFQAHLIDNSPVIAAYHDKDLNMVWANNAYQKRTGLSLEEIRGRKCYQVWNLSNPCRGCPVITAIETGENATHELTPDNQDHWPESQGYWLSQAAPVRDEQGAVIGAIEFAIDITGRKQAEEREAYLKRVLRTLLNVNQIVSRESDPVRLLQQVCVTLTETMGCGEAWIALTEKRAHRMLIKADEEFDARFEMFRERLAHGEFPTCMQRALEGGEVVVIAEPAAECIECPLSDFNANQARLIARMAFRDRIHGFVAVSAPIPYARDPEGVELFGKLAENIAFGLNRIENDAELQQANEWLSQILATTHEGFLMMDLADARILRTNDTFCDMLGYTQSEMLRLTVPDIEASERPEDVRQHVDLILKQKYDRFESVHRRKDGTTVDVEISASLLQGEQTRLMAFVRDITERKKAEQAQFLAKQQAEAANRAKSEFLANMSHEIRTPMNGVIGMTGLLLDTTLTEEQRHCAETVQSSAESLLTIINDILDFSKIEAGKLDLEMLAFDLPDLMEDLAATLALAAQEKGLEFICSVDSEVPARLHGDPGRLRQILTNLVSNAIKFTAQGEVVVAVAVAPAAVPPKERDAVASDAGKAITLRFSIRDTGMGIPEDKIGLLFNKFSQVDASVTRKFGGTGLGLAISRQLAEMMGGQAGVVSMPGQGSEFWFTARFGIQETTAGLATWDATGNLTGRRVLMVDDNATNLETLMNQLTTWGMRPKGVKSGEAALQVAAAAHVQGEPFDLAVVDFDMPGMDGAELARQFKADSRFQAIPLIMLTSLGQPGDARLFAGLGFAAYLNKPIRQSELFDTLSLVMATDDQKTPCAPIITRHLARETWRRHAPTPRLSGRVLVAEDNPVNQKVALGILKQFGLRGEAAANGREAISALQIMPFDLVLMDVMMPEMDGLEATRKIRCLETGTGRRIPIIAMTAGAMAEDRDNCLSAGMDDYLAKPVVREKLAEVLARWLPDR